MARSAGPEQAGSQTVCLTAPLGQGQGCPLETSPKHFPS